MRIPSDTLDQVATEIGRSSYWWGNIEYTLQSLCVNLARFNGEELNSEPVWGVLSTVLSHMDVRQRIAVAKVLAAQGVDPDLYGQIERLLNTIDNDLRNERNRFVHDHWQIEDEVIVRRKHGARVIRPQSRTLAIQQSTDRSYGDVAQIAEFTGRVATTFNQLVALERELTDLHDEIWPH
jgi:hypothetical protein